MALFRAAGTFNTPASSGTQAITGLGFQPKALILFTSGAVVDNGFSTSIRASFGFTTGPTAQHSMSSSSQHDSISRTYRRYHAQAITIDIESSGTSGAHWSADLVSFDSDGFTLDWDDVPGNSIRIHYLALGGDGIHAASAFNWQSGGSTGEQSITGLGFQPDLLLTTSIGRSETPPDDAIHASLSIGAFDGERQWAAAWMSETKSGTSNTRRAYLTNRCTANMTISGAVNNAAEGISLDAGGFTVNWRDKATSGQQMISLAIAGPDIRVDTTAKPTGSAPATHTVDDIGFEPVALLLASWMDESASSELTNSRQGIGIVTSDYEGFAGLNDANNAGSTARNARAYNSNDSGFQISNNNSQAVDAEAVLDEFNADGFVLTWDANDSNATRIGYVAISSEGGDPPPPPSPPSKTSRDNFTNEAGTTLDGGIDAEQSIIEVADSGVFPEPPFRVRINDEYLRVVEVDGETWTVERGIEGSAAASHSTGVEVWHVLTAGAVTAIRDAATESRDLYTIALIPDTQYLSSNSSWTPHFQALADYITDNADALNIRLILHLGDVVDSATETQYNRADGPMTTLFESGIPFLAVDGNHDYNSFTNRTLTRWNEYFGQSRYEDAPWLGGFKDVAASQNLYFNLMLGGKPTLVLGLETFPRTATMEWAGGIVAAHPHHDVIVVTHSFLHVDGTRTEDGSTHGPSHYNKGDDYSGAEMWDEYLKDWPNLKAVFSAHHLAGNLAERTDYADEGNAVYQQFSNWQGDDQGGDGRVVLLTINPQTGATFRRVYNPRHSEFDTTTGNERFAVIDQQRINIPALLDLLAE